MPLPVVPSSSTAGVTPAASCEGEATPNHSELLTLGDAGSLGTQSFTSLALSQDDGCAVEAVAAGSGREMQDHVLLCGGEQVASSSDGGAVLTMTTDDGTTLVVDVTPSSTSVIASTGPTDGLLQLSNTARQRLPA